MNAWARAWVRIGPVMGVLLATGCAGIERAPQADASPQVAPVAAPSTSTADKRTSTVHKTSPPGVAPSAPADRETSKSAAMPSKAPAKPTAASPAAAPSARSSASAAAPAKPQAAAPLDLKSLETRLKETQAIGVFTKLTLKNQIDQLLVQFRSFHQGKVKTTLADLRRSYDMLVLKVLALLQDTDPPLATAITGSREAIWGILSNPAKFAAV